MKILLLIIDRILALILWIGLFMFKHPIITLLAIIIFTIIEENTPSSSHEKNAEQTDFNGYSSIFDTYFYDWHGWTIYPGDGFHDARGYYRTYGDAFYDSSGKLVTLNDFFYDSQGIGRIYSYN